MAASQSLHASGGASPTCWLFLFSYLGSGLGYRRAMELAMQVCLRFFILILGWKYTWHSHLASQ